MGVTLTGVWEMEQQQDSVEVQKIVLLFSPVSSLQVTREYSFSGKGRNGGGNTYELSLMSRGK